MLKPPRPATVHEEAALDAVAGLPDASWVKQFVNYAYTQCAANAAYHIVNALCAVAVTAPNEYEARGPFVARTFPNLWGLVVGDTGVAQKTLAQNVYVDVLDAFPEYGEDKLIGPDPSAEETLILSLSLNPRQIIIDPDYGQFLNNTSGASNYRSKIRPALTRLFDGRSFSRIKAGRKGRGDQIVIANPRLSICAACTPIHLAEFTSMIDWQGGFMSRHLIIHAHREREIRAITPNVELQAWLVARLEQLYSYSAGNYTVGDEGEVAEDVRAHWQEWLAKHESRVRRAEPMIRGALQRADLLAAKIATILTWDLGRAGADGWSIEMDVLQAAIAIAELHVQSVRALIGTIAPSEAARVQQRVLGAVGDEWTQLGLIMKRAGLTSVRSAREHLEALMAMREVEQAGVREPVYRRRRDAVWERITAEMLAQV